MAEKETVQDSKDDGAIVIVEEAADPAPVSNDERNEYLKELKEQVAGEARASRDEEGLADSMVDLLDDENDDDAESGEQDDATEELEAEGDSDDDQEEAEGDDSSDEEHSQDDDQDDGVIKLELEPEQNSGPQFDQNLIARAKLRGLTEAEALSFGTPEALEAALSGATEEQSEELPDDNEGQDDGFDLDDTYLDENVKKILKQQQDQIKQLTEQVQSGGASKVQQATQEQLNVAFTEALNGLDEFYTDVFGKGGYDKVAPGSTHEKNLDALAQAMDQVANMKYSAGETVTDVGKLMRETIALKFPQLQEKAVEYRLSKKVNERASQSIQRARRNTSDEDDGLSPDQSAERAVAEVLRRAASRK